MVAELVRELLDLDGRMLRSLGLLFSRPGFLTLEYVNDRRFSYTSPVRMYLVISLVFFFVLPLILPEADSSRPAVAVPVDRYSKAMFLLLPLFALLLKLFYRRYYYLAHLVFVVHLFSAMFIVLAAMLSMEAAADRYIAVMILQVILLIYMLTYFVFALRVTYQESWLKSSLKSFTLLFIFMAGIALAIDGASQLSSNW